MSYYGVAPTPPRVWELWEAVRTRLDSARMQTILDGAGRIRLVHEDLSALGAEGTVWGRIVIVPVRRIYGEPTESAGRSRAVPFLLRTEIHSPGGGHNPAIPLEAAQDEGFVLLHGWKPEGFTRARVVGRLWRESAPQALPLWDDELGVWFLSAEYRAVLAPA